jgi:dihydrofolate reductase
MPKDYSMAAFFGSIDAAIMGRKTLDAARKMGGGGSWGSSMPTYVFSHSQPPGEREGVVYIDESPAAFMTKLRKNPGKDIWLMGAASWHASSSRTIWSIACISGLSRVLLGEGIPLFPSGFPQREFALVENKSYSMGLISLKYERSRQEQKHKA